MQGHRRRSSNRGGFLIGWTARNEVEAYETAQALNVVTRRRNKEEREEAQRFKAKAKITLPKLKFME